MRKAVAARCRAAAVAVLVIVGASMIAPGGGNATPARQGASFALPSGGTVPTALEADQRDLVAWAVERFEEQGLALPATRLEFRAGRSECDGHAGEYRSQPSRVRICDPSRWTMLHELAHAWADMNLTEEEREHFVRSRDLPSWNDPTDPWEQRGTEHAAEIITWGLMDTPRLVREVLPSPDGPRVVFRLRSIPNSTPEALRAGFVELTGHEPRFRTAAESITGALEARFQTTMAPIRRALSGCTARR